MIWVVVGVILAIVAIGAVVYWRISRRKQSRLISFVALCREPVEFDAAVLARLAGKAWNADLGYGDSEGADGFVACSGPVNIITHEGRMFLLNTFPDPYTKDAEKVAEGITDLRVRRLFSEHRAWFSCDALGVDRNTPEDEILDWYRRLGALFADLLDENCLLILVPDSDLAFPINDETDAALRSPDPVGALRESPTAPIIQIADDDPLMVKAVAQARAEWSKFVDAFEARAGENFSVKAPITRAGNTEFIWITVTAVEGDRIYGKLGNDPGNLGSLRLGSKVSVTMADLNDWCFVDPQDNLVGGFTIKALQNAQRRNRKR